MARRSPTTTDRFRQAPSPADEQLASAPDARLRTLVASQGADEGARRYLEELRWPNGVECPRCACDRTGWLESRRKYYCRGCGYQFRVTAGTVFHDSHLSLARWLVAVQLMVDSDRGFPANRLWACIGGSYKTAWFVNHRIRSAISRSLLGPGVPLALARVIEPASEATPDCRPGAGVEAGRRWALARRLLAGTYHRPSSEHLSAYWNEARWRSANIGNAEVFRETVCALLEADPLSYRQLTDHARPGHLAPSRRERRGGAPETTRGT